MKIFILSIPLILLTIQVFWSCNGQIVPVSINELQNFNLSSSTLKILKSTSYGFQSAILKGGFILPQITAVQISATASNLAKNLITNNVQNDLTNIISALNAIATSLAGCKPETSYPNDLNISTSCFSTSCSSTGIQCQALYVQLAIDELVTAMNAAEYHLNLTSSMLVGSASNIPSVSTITTQWLIVQASAAAYKTSTKSGPLINTVNSSFKKVLSAALNGTNVFLNKFSSGYMNLVSSVNIGNYNQSVDDFANSIMLSTALNAVYSQKFGPNFNRTVINEFRMGSSINGISVSSFIQPATSAVFDGLSGLTTTFNTEFSNFLNNIQSLVAEQQQNLTDLIVNAAQTLQIQYKDTQTYSDVNKCVVTTITQSFLPNWMLKNDLSSIVQPAQISASNLIINYTNLISSYRNMATNCYKVGCAGNTVYPYALWKYQCVNDVSFTSFCLSGGFPSTLQRCPSLKAQALIACLNNVASLIASLQPSTDMNMIVENTRNSFDALMETYVNDTMVLTSFNTKNIVAANCYYSRIYSSA